MRIFFTRISIGKEKTKTYVLHNILFLISLSNLPQSLFTFVFPPNKGEHSVAVRRTLDIKAYDNAL